MCCWDPKVRLALWDREKVDSTGSVGRCRRLSLGGERSSETRTRRGYAFELSPSLNSSKTRFVGGDTATGSIP